MKKPIRLSGLGLVLLFLLGGFQAAVCQRTGLEWEEVLAQFAQQIAQDVSADGLGGITAGVVVGRDLVWNLAEIGLKPR